MLDYKLHADITRKQNKVKKFRKEINDEPSMIETNLLLDRLMPRNEVEVYDQYLLRKVLNPKKKDGRFR